MLYVVLEELTIGPGRTLSVSPSSEEVLEVQASYLAGGAPPAPHLPARHSDVIGFA
jgi:hypothetical protein